jgi:NAD(P)H dehydrogenase (quinone)
MVKSIYIIYLFLFLSSANGQPLPKKILITYHSKTDHTKSMARAVAEGIQSIPGITLVLKTINETTTQDLIDADAIIVGSPVYNANVAPEVVKFISEWPFNGNPLKNKIGAAFVSAGGFSAGEELVQTNILHSMLVFGMIIVGGEDWTSPFGASAVTDEGKYKGSLKIDDHFTEKGYALGKRVAEITKKMN